VAPLPLARIPTKAELLAQKSGRALGWGVTDKGKTTPILVYIDVPLVDDAECGKSYSPLHQSMLCAGLERGGKDTCQGDSGGPFVLKRPDGKAGAYQQAAVISFGVGCGLPKFYGIYSSLIEGRAWIDSMLRN
jgi:secreted trypsin-like serine protease